MSASSSLTIDVNNYLGHNYVRYQNAILKMSIANPGAYYTLRETVETTVKEQCIKNMYDQIKSILSKGQTADGQQIMFDENRKPLAPGYPDQKLIEINLSLSKMLENALSDIVEHLLPIDANSIMKGSFYSSFFL